MAPVTYTAICERHGRWWEITVPELPSGRVTQARRLSQVDDTVRDLVSLMTGADPAGIDVRKQVRDSHARTSLLSGVAAGIRRALAGR
jgi:hypothetical protein